MKLKSFILPAFAAAVMFAGVPAMAESGMDPKPRQEASVSTDDLNKAKLDAYIMSVSQIQKIHSEMAPQIKGIEAEEEKKQAFEQMHQRMSSAIENIENISVSEYNEITQAAQDDPELKQLINDHYKNMVKEQQQGG